MAEGLNSVQLIGNLGDDPELRNTQGDRSVLNLRLACNERFKSGDEWKERCEWVTVELWGARADALAKLLRKGETIFVEGSLRTQSWDDKDGGGKRYKTVVNANNVILLGGKRDRDDDRPRNGRSRDDDRSSRSRDDDRGRHDERPRDDDRGRREERDGRGRDDDRGARDDRGGFER